MAQRMTAAILLLAAALLSACGAIPKLDGDPVKLSSIHTIAVIHARGPRSTPWSA